MIRDTQIYIIPLNLELCCTFQRENLVDGVMKLLSINWSSEEIAAKCLVQYLNIISSSLGGTVMSISINDRLSRYHLSDDCLYDKCISIVSYDFLPLFNMANEHRKKERKKKCL